MFKSLKLAYILEMKDPLRNFLDKIKPTFQGKEVYIIIFLSLT